MFAAVPVPECDYFRFALRSTALPPLTSTLPFAERARRVFIRRRTNHFHSLAFSGKNADGVPLTGHRHAMFLPEDADHDGSIDHLTVCAAGGFDHADWEALRSCPSFFGTHGQPSIELRPVAAGRGAARTGRVVASYERTDISGRSGGRTAGPQATGHLIDAEGCSPTSAAARAGGLLATATTWVSATPFSLPRFATAGRGRKQRARDTAVEQLRRELRNRGLSDPVRVFELPGTTLADGRLIEWSDFNTERRKGTSGYGLAGFRLEFAEPVAGPLALGFGCHFGLGLFRPA
jgi:CRISPR-associated protein Csb2